MSIAMSTVSDAVIERSVTITPEDCTLHSEDINEMFQIDRCVKWIKNGSYSKVGLQFPDELLEYASEVAFRIRESLGYQVYILADTTFASCCVDEVAAEHIGADSIIHFGRSCLSKNERLPVLTILSPYIHVNVDTVCQSLNNSITDKQTPLILLYDTRCHHAVNDVFNKLRSTFLNIILSKLIIPGDFNEELKDENDESLTLSFNGRHICLGKDKQIKNYNFIYLGPQSSTLTTLAIRFPENTFYQVHPENDQVELVNMTKTIMKRSLKLEQIKDAKIIGILMGTLGKKNYLKIVKRLKEIIKNCGKKSYTFVVGKPNEAKLANISEVDVYVYVACPETTLVERSFDAALYKMLVTPWEVELALNPAREWNLSFETDFSELLPDGRSYCSLQPCNSSHFEASVSLLTNKTQCLGIKEDNDLVSHNQDSTVSLRQEGVIAPLHVGGGGEILTNRSWAGLDPSAPSKYPLQAVKGREGIASSYVHEKEDTAST